MTRRSILTTATMLSAAIMVTLSISSSILAAPARSCGPSTVQGSTGKPWDPTFKGTFKCMERGMIDCGNGGSCPQGSRCLVDSRGAPAGCGGVTGQGPRCSNGKRCIPGFVCMPGRASGCYNPTTSYVCGGVAVCGKELRYAPGDRCYPCFARRRDGT